MTVHLQPPFHTLPDGGYEIIQKGPIAFWAPAEMTAGVWKGPCGRFRASPDDGVLAVRTTEPKTTEKGRTKT